MQLQRKLGTIVEGGTVNLQVIIGNVLGIYCASVNSRLSLGNFCFEKDTNALDF